MTSNRLHQITRTLLGAVAAAALLIMGGEASSAVQPWQAAVGYDRLVNALGSAAPVGAGVSIAIIEGGTQYFPDANVPEFQAAGDPLNQAVFFSDGSFQSTAFSSHAQNVAAYVVGNFLGLSKGANAVTIFQADNWLNNQLYYNGTQTPEVQLFDVQNHSWVGSFGSASQDQSALRRYDYVIDHDEVTAVVGANNNPTNLDPLVNPDPGLVHPNLLAHSYNAIVAGRTVGRHSRGATQSIYGPGRYRPDLVSSATSTSVATGQISSAAGLIRGVVAGTDADRSETAKAILMAGATKEEFASYVEPSTSVANPWDRTATRPLDDVFGAGELNVFNSYLMTVGGRHAGSTTQPVTAAKSYGWDYQDRKADSAVGDIYYNFVVPGGSSAQELSIILAWNVKVTDTNSGMNFEPMESLQNLNLALYDSTASFLGTMIDQSASAVDNVEHIYQTDLGPGTYTLKVSGAASWDYGLAWRTSTLFDQPNADFDEDGAVTGNDFLTWQRNLGKLVGALHTDGDGDGDGDVDADDLGLFQAGVMPAPVVARALASAVPEPTALASAIAAIGFSALALHRASQRRSL